MKTHIIGLCMVLALVGMSGIVAAAEERVTFPPISNAAVERAIFNEITPPQVKDVIGGVEVGGLHFRSELKTVANQPEPWAYRENGDRMGFAFGHMGWDIGTPLHVGARPARITQTSVGTSPAVFTYPGAITQGIDVKIVQDNYRWQKIVEIESLAALGKMPVGAKYLEISFEVSGDFVLPDGVITGRVPFGNDSFLQPVRAWDSSDDVLNGSGSYGVVAKNVVTKRIPVEWLKSATYPVQTDLTITYGTENVYNSADTIYMSVATLDSTHFVVAYNALSGTGNGTALIGVVSGTTISSYGAESTFNYAVSSHISVSAIDSTHFVVGYSDTGNSGHGTAIIGTVSGTTISFGSETVFNPGSTADVRVAVLDSAHFMVAYRDAGNSNRGTTIIGSVSGTTISYGSEYVFNSDTTSELSAGVLDSTHFVVAFRDVGASSYGTAIIGTVSGTTVSYGTKSVYNLATTVYNSVAVLDSTHFVVAFKDDGGADYGIAIVGAVSGTTISFGSENMFNAADTRYIAAAALGSARFVVTYSDYGNYYYGTSMIGNVSGTTISSYGAETVFNSATSGRLSAGSFDVTRFVVVYNDGGNSGYGTAIVGSVPSATPANPIAVVSITPDPLYTNNTQDVSISFGITHDYPLNHTSLAILSAVNYTEDANGYNCYGQLRYPPTDIADVDPTGTLGNVFRGVHRNITPYLTFEDNDTITGGDNYKWNGYDYDDASVSFNNVNSTYTFVNVTMHPLETCTTFKYISEQRILDATKTTISVGRSQSVIMKMANLEELLLRDDNYTVSLYFDSAASPPSALPSADLLVYCGNASFNPLTDDFTTSPNACVVDTLNYTRWRTGAVQIDGEYRMFAKTTVSPELVTFDPTPIMYIGLFSGTQSSKPYLLNMTNDAISGVNVSFAATDTLWSVNELSHVTTAEAYTANMMAKFSRTGEQLEYQLHIADTGGNWSVSDVGVHTIDDSKFDPTTPSFAYFNATCGGVYVDDVYMDGTYDNGMMWIGINPSLDPDGGPVTHNLTLHKSAGDYVCVINNTFDGTSLIEIEFTTTPYYSLTESYTLRCIATDDDGVSVTTWLENNFTLAADGTTGVIASDDLVWFWGYSDIPALYTAVSDPSIMSLSGGIYTMHRPFYKSKCNDSFTFDEDVHLRSNGGDDVAHFRAIGTIYFENCDVRAWNTTSDSVATEWGPSEHRAHLLFATNLDGYIKNCDMSYLGTDVYRQEGINFIDIDDFVIEGSTFEYNSRGVLFENCDDINMTGCTISNNLEVGTGLYFIGNSTITNGVYDHNGHNSEAHSGIRAYDCLYTTIEGTTITDSALHGLWMQYSDHNIVDTCGVTGSGSGRDYYFSSWSNNNTITDATQSFDIRSTSSSDVNITTTDHSVFIETSQYIPTITTDGSYMRHHGVSATFSIGLVDMYVTPHGGTLTMPAFVFGETTTFTLDTSDPITYVEISATRTGWADMIMWLAVDTVFYDDYNATAAGYVAYNYTSGFSGSPIGFSIHEEYEIILEGWQKLGEDTAGGYADFVTIIGVGILIIIVGGIIIGFRSFAGEISPEVVIIVAIAIGLGLLILVTMVEVIPSAMAPMEEITMEGI